MTAVAMDFCACAPSILRQITSFQKPHIGGVIEGVWWRDGSSPKCLNDKMFPEIFVQVSLYFVLQSAVGVSNLAQAQYMMAYTCTSLYFFDLIKDG